MKKQQQNPAGYSIKVQKVDRPTNRSYYLNLPAVLAEALEIKKGEEMKWLVEDKNLLLLSRSHWKPPRKLRAKP
jgi:antitoxin component of MazEF toxin-antitoxin module